MIEFDAKDMAATFVNRRPWTVVPVLAVIEADARMIPEKLEFTPKVADDPTDQ